MMTEDLFDDYGHIDFEDDGDDGFLDMDALAAAEQLSIGAKALADDGSILDLAALSADSYASDTIPGIALNGVNGCSSNGVIGMDGAGGDNKESTGRWTREEHLLFIKGLEMYGKGWKKIAGLIKTRTVVQIRTHAQKYFLKLAKARQNGGGDMHSGSLSLDGKSFTHGMRKKKLRRRRHDKPIAVAPPLQPFIKIRKEGGEGPEPIDVDTGLYQFLSAPMGTISTTPSTLQLPNVDDANAGTAADGEVVVAKTSPTNKEACDEDEDGAPAGNVMNMPPSATLRTCNSLTSFSGVTMVERLRLNSSERSLPEWYAKGEHVASLLKEAEALDWGVQLVKQKASPPTETSSTAQATAAPPASAATDEKPTATAAEGEESSPVATVTEEDKKEDASPQTVAADFSEGKQDVKPETAISTTDESSPDDKNPMEADSAEIEVKLELPDMEEPAADNEARRVGSKASFAAMSQIDEGDPNAGAPPLSPASSIDAATTEPAISGPSSPMPTAVKVTDRAGYTVKKVAMEAIDVTAASTTTATSATDVVESSTPTAGAKKVTSLVTASPSSSDKNGSDSESDVLGGIVF